MPNRWQMPHKGGISAGGEPLRQAGYGIAPGDFPQNGAKTAGNTLCINEDFCGSLRKRTKQDRVLHGVVALPNYEKVPIVDTAMRCGIVLNSRTFGRTEVEASCPFCGDHGAGKYHLFLNTTKDLYNCKLCGAKGNSVSLYAKRNGITNGEAFRALKEGGNVYPLPQMPTPQNTERQPQSLENRHCVYTKMLSYLTLLDRHRENLRERGLSDQAISEHQYRSMPETPEAKRLLASLLSMEFDLQGIPGFYTHRGQWTVAGSKGFLIPVQDKNGLIQGLKIRLDNEGRKYRWLSSRDLPNGTRSFSWVHVTGNTQSKRAFVTEGPLKGDVASHLSGDSLFVCIGGVNALKGLKVTLIQLGVTEVVEAMDMDQHTNPHIRNAIQNLRKEIQTIPHLRYSKYNWNPAFKGVDDYLLSRTAEA